MKEKVNKMGTAPISKLLIFMGIPMIISMALQALYNIIDTYFITGITDTEVSASATAAVGLAFPVQMLMVAIAIGTGVGANALLSKSLGQGNREKVNRTAGNALFLGLIIYVVYLLFGLFLAKPFARLMSSSEIVQDFTSKYITICCTMSFGIVFFAVYEKLLQSTGKTLFSTIAQIAGAVTNIVLDPVFIYEKGKGIGVFGLGIAGAAWATVIGQIVSTVLAMIFHYALNREIKNHIKYLKPDGKIILEIYSVGVAAIVAQALMAFMAMAMNKVLGIVDDKLIEEGLASNDAPPYVTSYTVYYKIQQFVLFLAFGLRDAITPIVSFNYGVGDKKRVTNGLKFGLLYTTVLMVLGLIVVECAAQPLIGIFDNGLTELGLQFCIRAAQIISISFIFAGANIALQGIFQALGSGLASLIISLCRQLVLVIPVAWIFAVIAKQNPSEMDWLIWITFIISEGVSAVIAFVMMRSIYKKKIANLGNGSSAEEIPAAPLSLGDAADGQAADEAVTPDGEANDPAETDEAAADVSEENAETDEETTDKNAENQTK